MKKTIIAIVMITIISGGLMASEVATKEVKKVFQDEEKRQIIHQIFSAGCFNKTWEYIEKEDLNEADIENMIVLSNASLYHWKQRDDCTPKNLSIAYWQLARVYALAEKLNMAKDYANKCIDISVEEKLDPFSLGYGYEALARCFLREKKNKLAQKYLNKGYTELKKIENKEDKKYLEADLEDIKNKLNKQSD